MEVLVRDGAEILSKIRNLLVVSMEEGNMMPTYVVLYIYICTCIICFSHLPYEPQPWAAHLSGGESRLLLFRRGPAENCVGNILGLLAGLLLRKI